MCSLVRKVSGTTMVSLTPARVGETIALGLEVSWLGGDPQTVKYQDVSYRNGPRRFVSLPCGKHHNPNPPY